MSAEAFAANLEYNLQNLTKRIHTNNYGPNSLKAVFLPKPNSSKERMICIPTVIDRLIQRTIVQHLVSTKRLPIYRSSSFGFIKGRGTSAAIDAAKALRLSHAWCLKTDIETFFDSIPRHYLKKRISETLGRSSLVPIISKFVDCDIKSNPRTTAKLLEQKLKLGAGLRQGMPLSPILANLVLSEFDRSIERLKIPMVRYADDLLLFFNSKEDAQRGHDTIKATLRDIELNIPEIADNSKTRVFGPQEPIDFLGREIIYLPGEGRYVSTIGKKQIQKIREKLEREYSYSAQSKDSTFQEAVVDLWKSISAYQGIYRDAHNFARFDNELRHIGRKVISKFFSDIFGADALGGLDNYKKNFLGIGHLDLSTPVNDLEFN